MEDGYFGNDSATFGDRVAAAREAQGLTQEDLCRKLGIKLKTVRGWEDDVAEPRANKLALLAGLLNVSMRWLLTGEGQGIHAPEDGVELSGDIREILMDMRRTKTEFAQLADHLGQLEKRLGKLLQAVE